MPLLLVLLRVRVRGRCPPAGKRGIILAPNHGSWVDPWLVQYAVYPQRVTFLMTEIYFDLPVVGIYFRAAGTRPIREKGPSVAGLRAATEALMEGDIVCVFPEGELTRDGKIGRGRRGVARLARRTGATVVPIGIDGTLEIFSRLQPRPRRGTATLSIGAPMLYEGTPDREGENAFTERLMGRITALAQGIRSRTLSADSRRSRHLT